MKWLTLNYGHTLLVNLLGNKEAEQILSETYQVDYSNHSIVNTLNVITLETSKTLNLL